MLRLVLPSTKYKVSFLKAVKEVKRAKPDLSHSYAKLDYDKIKEDFDGFVKKIKLRAQGIGLQKGYIPDTVYWLVDGDTYIGRVSIRHWLTPNLRRIGGHIGYETRPSERRKGDGAKMLELALPKAKKLGIKKVLITCDETNIGSKKIIEKNGGKFEDKYKMGPGKPDKLRYWIKL